MTVLAASAAPTVAIPIYTPRTIPVAIGAAFLDGIYAGVIRGVDGAVDQHLILIDQEAVGVSWDEAVAFAEIAGGALPTRREQALLFANLPERFQPSWYWSGEQHASDPVHAWGQGFDDGYQYDDLKSYAGRARAVRRLPI